MDNKDQYAYWLACVKGCTRRVQKRLFGVCAGAEEVYWLNQRQLEKIPGILPKDVIRIVESKKN